MKQDEFIIYRNMEQGEILNLVREALDEDCSEERRRECLYEALNGLVELAGGHGFYGNIWKDYLAYLLASHENAFSRACEGRGRVEGSINLLAVHDFALFGKLFQLDLKELGERTGLPFLTALSDYRSVNEDSYIFNKRVRNRICQLADSLGEAGDGEEFLDILTEFYKEFGVGRLGLNKAFRIEDETGQAVIRPIQNVEHVYLNQLVGYERQKDRLKANTEAFLEGRTANNCLLYGDAGTGKSSCVKALLNEYYEKGLRIIEVYRHQMQLLPSVISQIKDRNYRFILFMDDLSFEDFETEYKYLKAIIEGGLERKPDNVLIYATSNRRHLIREKFSDKRERDEELHENDTVQEKLSLASRFGEQIYFGRPDKEAYQDIVRELAKRYEISLSEEELLLEANKWELGHGGPSGRTAVQFIHHLAGRKA